jgi:putative transposase
MKTKYDPNKHHRRSIRLKGYDYAQAGRYFVTFCVKDRQHFFGEIIEDEMYLNDAGIMIEKWYLELENKFPKIRCHEYVVMPNHFHAIVQIIDVVDNVSGDVSGEHTGSPLPNSPIISDEQKITNSPNVSDGRGEPMCSPETSDEPNDANSLNVSDAINFLKTDTNHVEQGRHAGLPLQSSIQPPIEQDRHAGLPQQLPQPLPQQKPILGEHKDSPLWEVVQWFKTMSTNEYIRGVKTLGWERFNGKLWQRNYYEHIIRNDESCEKIATYIINNPKNWEKDSLR